MFSDAHQDKELFSLIEKETQRQSNHLEMIASENFVSPQVLEAMGSTPTNKYAEGYPGKRYYSGCEVVDQIENLCIERAKKLFQADFVNVQAHSGSQANMAVYFAFLEPGDTILSMDLAHGGHLSHGSPVNFTGKLYNIVSYGVDETTQRMDYDQIRDLAKKNQPKMIVCGASAYPRIIDFEAFRGIADEVGAILLADMAHIAGLVATGQHPSPVPYCDLVTSTTHKTLRGPRGGIIMGKKEHEKKINGRVFPGIQGGPFMHIIAAKAVAFHEALQSDFVDYCKQIVVNAKSLAQSLHADDIDLCTGGTDNHMLLLDLRRQGITGKNAEHALEQAGIATNKNMVPFDPESPFITSGIRMGTPALTTRGMKESEMKIIAGWISKVLSNVSDAKVQSDVRSQVEELCKDFPLYS
ncbi:MAG: serine hydroxymethyltransferase [Bdellovibrionales bacterium]|nr:serine hydroxymethyltransferase [Bdellovibrionales bacterium]